MQSGVIRTSGSDALGRHEILQARCQILRIAALSIKGYVFRNAIIVLGPLSAEEVRNRLMLLVEFLAFPVAGMVEIA